MLAGGRSISVLSALARHLPFNSPVKLSASSAAAPRKDAQHVDFVMNQYLPTGIRSALEGAHQKYFQS